MIKGSQRRIEANASSQASLQLRLLGPPETIWNGKPLEIPRRQPRAILYHLGTQPQPVPRTKLCLLFWPDITESEARRHLSNQIYNLRRALPDPELIQTPNGQLSLNPQHTWSDVKVFDHHSQSSQSKKLQQSADMYRGPFLDGFSLAEAKEFSLWVDRERRTFERVYLEILSDLIKIYTDQGEYDAAIAHARRYLQIDDLAEDVHRRLIDLYAAQGDRSAALRQFEQCATILERELGVDPLPETRDVYLAVLGKQKFPAEPPSLPQFWRSLPNLEAPLVGREAAMSKLNAAFSQARTGIGSALFISGDAGVGKTRLLVEFMSDHAREATILTSGGYEALVDVSYLPLVEALRPILPEVDWSSLDFDPLHMAGLVNLLPELRHHIPNILEPSSGEQPQEESPLFRGLEHLLLGLARQYPPLILCLDDLQWTDKTTRSWIVYLAKRLNHAPLLLLCSYRTEEKAVVEPLRASLARLNVLEHVHLQDLTEEEVKFLVYRLSGQTTGYENLNRNLHRLTGGNPFFLLETLRSLFEAGLLEQNQSGWQGDLDQLSASFDEFTWSDSLTETVLRRLRRLHPNAAQVLEAGAVIGKNFDLEIVKAASGRSEYEVAIALEELAARQLITVGDDSYYFKHDLIRAIVEDNLSFGRRQLLHRRAGEVLEQRETCNAAALARHFSAAGNTTKAVSYLLQAGDEARQLYSHKNALEFYQRALSYQEDNEAFSDAARTLMRLGMTNQIALDFRRAHQAFEKSFALRRQILPNSQNDPPPAPHPLRLLLSSVPIPMLLYLNDPLVLDPGNLRPAYIYIKQLFSGLLRAGNNWSIQPEVAKSWQVSENGCHYVFHLRDDAIWSDGVPVTAQDFEFAWKRMLNPQTGRDRHKYPSELYVIQGAQAFHRGETSNPDTVAVRSLDPLTLEVHLEEPAEYFLDLLTYYKMFPLPRHVVERLETTWTDPAHLVTNGPFQLQDWQPGELVTLVRNPTYFRPFLGNINQVSISQKRLPPADQLESYRDGKVDLISLNMETYPARFQHIDEYHQVDAGRTYLLGFGLAKSPFRDRRIRQALGMVIDKNELAKQTMHGFDMPVTGGLLPPSFPGHSPGIGLPYNPERARRLLAEAGYPDGKGFPRTELLTINARVRYAQILQRLWEHHLGIHIQPKVVAWEDFHPNFRQATLFIIGWVAPNPTPYNYLRDGARYLAGYWQNEEFDQLFQKAVSMSDLDERLRLYRQADRILMKEAAILPLFYRVDHYLVKPWLKIPLQDYSLKDAIIAPH
jgi:ABC-type oligopeptide transport system substrate-binding subunit/DNA-binding SARP family transcriptional activator